MKKITKGKIKKILINLIGIIIILVLFVIKNIIL